VDQKVDRILMIIALVYNDV